MTIALIELRVAADDPFAAPALKRQGQRNLRGVTPLADAFSSRGKRRAALPQPREAGSQLSERALGAHCESRRGYDTRQER